jgi:hypothetical protein
LCLQNLRFLNFGFGGFGGLQPGASPLWVRPSFTVRKYVLGWIAACEIVCEIHVAQQLVTLSLPNAEQTLSMWGIHFQN